MDQFNRRIIGFGVHVGDVDGIALCRKFNSSISAMGTPKYLSSDNDTLFEYLQWQANLRIIDIEEINSIPNTPISHTFIERLIGTIRRVYLDQTLFWKNIDLGRKLANFQTYYNHHRTHNLRRGATPAEKAVGNSKSAIRLSIFR